LSITDRRRRRRRYGAAVLLAMGLFVAGWNGVVPLPGIAFAREGGVLIDVGGLQQSLRQARTELELERAARAAADAQVAALNEELAQLRAEAGFLKEQASRSGRR
jgi:hypothetical protein